jgi:SAM-dependent methyltransferase
VNNRFRNAGGGTATACILCGEARVREFLDLGETPLANKFLTCAELREPELTFPLRVGFCGACGHSQLSTIVPPRAMFDHYLYVSSASTTLRDHLHGLARYAVARLGLTARDLVVDVGCNDGTLLQGFLGQGVRVQGVDPASNLAELASAKGVPVHVGYFGERTARSLRQTHGTVKLITATNTFPHLPDLADFMRGVDALLEEDGSLLIEAHYLGDLLGQGAFDTVYHEHVSYWALAPMQRLFERHGFEVKDVQRLPIHHGQLRVLVQRRHVGSVIPTVAQLIEDERALGLDRYETFAAFAEKTQKIRGGLIDRLDTLRAAGKRVVGYGAPAKGNTLLSFLGVGPDRIPYIADRSPLKQGRFTPGSHIPVVPPERILEDQPDYLLLFAWNFADEIIAQQAEYRRRGGQFIIPIPEVRIV